jgi:SAM-dependent methyltransferase
MDNPTSSDAVFAGSVPDIYDDYLVPLIFEDCADELAGRAARTDPQAVLELAAGTGVASRALARHLSPDIALTCTDLNQAMLDRAAEVGAARPIDWRQADAQQLPFPDDSFDVIVCQFGVMFFPDKRAAFAEARRVLRPGGRLVYNTWDTIETSEFADVVTEAVGTLFPDDPPRFLARTPHGYFDEHTLRDDLAQSFTDVTIDGFEARSIAATAAHPAIAYCQGTPLRDEITARDPSLLTDATNAATAAIAARFGETDVDGLIRALVVDATARI